jgi:signal transduction histidine kinase
MEGNGLRGMRERVEMLGGTLDRRNKSGTTLTITLPLKEVAIKDVAEKEAIAYPEKAHEFESSR